MKKTIFIFGVLLLVSACGASDETNPNASADVQAAVDQAVGEANEIAKKALRGEQIGTADEGTEACAYFESGVIPELFQVDAAKISYTRSIPVKSAGHVVCMATWEKPNKAELEAGYQEAVKEWTMAMTRGGGKNQPKYPRTDNNISLTLTANKYSSAAEAVAGLDSTVATMSKGVTFEVGGEQHTAQMIFEKPIEGVGDKAVFTNKGKLLVAYDAKLITVTASVSEDPAIKRQQTVQLAQRLISGR